MFTLKVFLCIIPRDRKKRSGDRGSRIGVNARRTLAYPEFYATCGRGLELMREEHSHILIFMRPVVADWSLMRKGSIYQGIVERVDFPNKGIIKVTGKIEEAGTPQEILLPASEGDNEIAVVKNVIEGQTVLFSVSKIRKGKGEGRLLKVVEKSAHEINSPCPHFGKCGGCSYLTLPYEEQLGLKETQVKRLLKDVIEKQGSSIEELFEPIKGSPLQWAYRNKMEFSFGDEEKEGPLSLGMHKKGSLYDIVTVDQCQIVDEDYRTILKCVLDFFAKSKLPFYHRMRHDGYLRHLLVRKASKTGEIMIALITTTQAEGDLKALTEELLALQGINLKGDQIGQSKLKGKVVGILHTKNDSVADIVQSDETITLYGQDYFYEEILGLRFKISQFSFFQTNSLGAEVLYETAREFVGDLSEAGRNEKIVFDLYSGTGTIAQMLSPVAKKVVGVEIVEEAVEAARLNAELNDLHNCKFIAGDVLKVLDNIVEKPDFILLDPPRDGIHPKALSKIIEYGVDRIVYISCKPTSLARDLEVFVENGYRVERITAVDMFPGTVHVEVVTCLQRVNS